MGEESVKEIKAGEDHLYALREGFNIGGWSHSNFLNSSTGDGISEVDLSCIYSFIEVGEKTDGDQTYKVYVLKNHANNKYLSNGNELYVQSKAKAFHFTARPAVENPKANWNLWSDYSHCVNVDKCAGAEAANAWVLCSIKERSYIGFIHNPSFSSYTDTMNWLIYEAVEREVSPFEKLNIIFAQYFKVDVSEENYPIGTQPGCVSQDLFDNLKSVYDEAVALTQKSEDPSKNEAYTKSRQDIIDVFERYEKEVVRVTNGYYIFVNHRSMDAAYDAGNIVKCQKGLARPTPWNLENTKYIWKIYESSTKGRYYFQNWATGRFIGQTPGTSSANPMVADSTVKISLPQYQGIWFRMHDGKMFMHNDGAYKIVGWNSTGTGNLFRFETVPADTIALLQSQVEQNKMNQRLARLIKKAKTDVEGVQTMSGITFNGEYNSNAAGLVKEFEAANSVETAEGKPEWAFDGKLNTYFHTMWHADKAPQDDWHWVQVDLGKAVKELYVKFSYRHNNNNSNPSRYSFVAAEDDKLDAPQWMDTLAEDTAIYAYATPFPDNLRDSTTCIQKVTFSRPAQHVRFVVTRTHANQVRGFGPTWHVSELRFYDAAECVESPLYAMVPQEVKDALNTVMTNAQAEVDGAVATEATYEALEAALEAFWDAYPSPKHLNSMMETAEKMHEIAVEGTDLGYFEEGAKDAFWAVIEEIKAKMEKPLGLAELEVCEKQLKEAIDTFNSKLHVPESGKVYRILSAAHPKDDGSEDKLIGSVVASLNADLLHGTPVWRYDVNEGVSERFNTLWYVEKDEAGYSFKNLANGYYMGNPYEGLTEEELEELSFDEVGYSTTPKHFSFISGIDAGTFILQMKEGQFINLQPTGNVVHWHGGYTSRGSWFTFEEVTEDDFEATYRIDAAPGQTQIKALPVNLGYVYGNNNSALKVLGVKDGVIQLEEYAEGEVIAAGTPFIITTDAADEENGVIAENSILADLVDTDLESQLSLEYNYSPVEQNGLISTAVRFDLEAGYGFLNDGKVMVSEGGETVAAGSGFFNKTLPTVTEEGSFQLILEGDITGEGTGVQNIKVVKNEASDVYTISGVKVRDNVKAGVATKGLPKGVYIVGGKKVIVK